jgi:hypothetical protein
VLAVLAVPTLVACGSAHAHGRSAGWRLTTYYTAVESFHHEPRVQVRGCLRLECEFGRDVVGSYPRGFVRAVHDEGSGRITSGTHRGRYLNWSSDTGYWLDSRPRDAGGGSLTPYVTAAADPSVLGRGVRFQVVRCGSSQDDGSALDPAACGRMRSARWVVRDEFTPGLGGRRHLDLYLGEEDREDFEATSPRYLDSTGATVEVRRR